MRGESEYSLIMANLVRSTVSDGAASWTSVDLETHNIWLRQLPQPQISPDILRNVNVNDANAEIFVNTHVAGLTRTEICNYCQCSKS